jgi:hypothetical protein
VLYILFVVGGEGNFKADVLAVDVGEELFLLKNGGIHDILEVSFG